MKLGQLLNTLTSAEQLFGPNATVLFEPTAMVADKIVCGGLNQDGSAYIWIRLKENQK